MISGVGAFILAIIAMSQLAWMVTTWIRAKHGLPVENEWGCMVHKADPELAERNAELEARLAQHETRIRTLEKIVTDSGYQTTRAIEALRESESETGSGVPIDDALKSPVGDWRK